VRLQSSPPSATVGPLAAPARMTAPVLVSGADRYRGHLPICSKPYAKPNRELNQPILAAWRRSAMVSRRLGRRCDERRSTVRLKGRRGAHPPVCDVIGGLPVAVSAREEDPELVRRPQTDPQMRRHSAPFRFLSIFRKESARNCASADELGHGAGDGFGLLPSHRQ
jgi:hypothetical protein